MRTSAKYIFREQKRALRWLTFIKMVRRSFNQTYFSTEQIWHLDLLPQVIGQGQQILHKSIRGLVITI